MEGVVQKHSQELATQLWSIANDLRGNMDASKFKNYILGVIFYRYLSEKTENYMMEVLKRDNISYTEALENEDYSSMIRDISIAHLGYVIEFKYLWSSLIGEIKEGKFSIEHFESAISKLVGSTKGEKSEVAFDKLFDDMNLQDKDLGKEVSDRTELISKIMLKINDISFNMDNAEIDVLGTAYMILISLFASDAGKKGGEFFTPTCASKLLARLATVGLQKAKYVADSCAGSGSLLLQVQNCLSADSITKFYATEKNGSNYNLLRMNLLMHDVPYNKFECFNADSIKSDNYYKDGEPILFDIQVENPPYSAKYDNNQSLLDDPRYHGCGVLAPKTKADLMFVEHMVYHMADDGRVVVLLPHGVLFRGNTEATIRQHLIKSLNVVDAIIGLPANLFHGTSIPTVCIVLKKKRNGNSGNILFIDASKEFKPGKNQNELTDENVDKIVNAYIERKDIDKYAHVASMEEIEKNEYNCNIPRYVDTSEEEEEIDISAVKAELADIIAKKQKAMYKVNSTMKLLGL